MSAPKPNIFDYTQEEDFLSLTREKKPTPKPFNDQRSYSAMLTVAPKFEFKESVIMEKLVKKPTPIEEKQADKSKLKTIFESFESVDSRTKSHTDVPPNLRKESSNKTLFKEGSIPPVLRTQDSFFPLLRSQDSKESLQSIKKAVPSFKETRSFFNEQHFDEITVDLESRTNSTSYILTERDRSLLDFTLDYPPNPTFFCEPFTEIRENLFGDLDPDDKVACFAVSTGNLAFSSSSMVTIFDLKTKVKRKLKLEKDSPCVLDISYDDETIAIGFVSGAVSFYEILTMKLLKLFPRLMSSRILALKFYHNSGHSIKEGRLLISDSAENVSKVVFEKGIFGYDADSQLLIKEWGQFFRIEILNNSSHFWEKNRLAALASAKQIAIVSLEPKPFRIMSFYRPEYISERVLPSISWNESNTPYFKREAPRKEAEIEEKHEEIEKGDFLAEMEQQGLLTEKEPDLKAHDHKDKSIKSISPIKQQKDVLRSENDQKSMKLASQPGSSKIIGGSETEINQDKTLKTPENKPLTSTLLSILWGSVVFIVRVFQGHEKNTFGNKIEKYYQMNFTGFVCFFLNEKLLMLIETCDEQIEKGEIVNVDTFPNFQETENLASSFFLNSFSFPHNHEIPETQSFLVKLPISFQTVLKDSQNMLLPLKLVNFNRENTKSRVIYCHEKSRIMEMGVLSSAGFFGSLEKKPNLEVSEVIFHFLNVYRGKTSFLRDNPESSNLIVSALVQDFTRGMLENRDFSFPLVFLLISIKDFGFLFNEILPAMQEKGREEEFFLILEVFISRKNVDFIPERSLRSVVSYYCKHGRMGLVHELVFALDYKRIDVCPIITLCLEFHLLKGLIYVSTVFSEDFITPLIKIFSLYETFQHLDGECAKEVAQDQAKFSRVEESKEPPKAPPIDFGGQCLKYLSLCFRRKLINNAEIPNDSYPVVLHQLIIWVFEPDNLRKLHAIDTQIFFEMMFLLFSTENTQHLQKFRIEDLKILTESSWLLEIEAQNPEFKAQNYFLIGILYLKTKESYWLSLFIGKIVNLKRFYIPPTEVLSGLKVLLENSSLLDYYIEQDWSIEPEQLAYERDEIRKSEFLIEMLNYVMNKVDESALDAVLAMQEVSLYGKFNAEVQVLRKNYQSTFEIYTRSKNKLFQKSMLSWLSALMKRLFHTKDSAIQQINELILFYLPSLVQISTAETHELISRYNKSAEKTVIKYLSSYPDLQKQYLEKLLKYRETGKQLDDELLLIHIELLCRQQTENELLENLKRWEYPLDESLKLCRKYRKNEASAYLLERTGASEEALSLYFQMIKEEVENFKIQKESQAHFAQNVNHIVDLAVLLCKKAVLLESRTQEWVRFLDFMQKNLSDVENSEFWNVLFQNVFAEFVKNVPLPWLLESVREKYGRLSMRYVKNAFTELFTNYLYSRNIINNANTIVKEEILEKNSQNLWKCVFS